MKNTAEMSTIISDINPYSMRLSHNWVLYSHLPHDTNWTLSSYKRVHTISTVGDAIAITDKEIIPETESIVQNSMMFLMKEEVAPMWEDKYNKNGGSFAYVVNTKDIYDVWTDAIYSIVGNTISENEAFVNGVNGITISKKKDFHIFKIWMKDCSIQNPSHVTACIKGLSAKGCLFYKHGEKKK